MKAILILMCLNSLLVGCSIHVETHDTFYIIGNTAVIKGAHNELNEPKKQKENHREAGNNAPPSCGPGVVDTAL